MGLEHEFLIVSAAEHAPAEYAHLSGAAGTVRLHDDVLRYVGDTLTWIPTLNPATGKMGCGLNFYGPTAILVDGAPVAAQIFGTWAQLFRLGPEEIELTGLWTSIEGEPGSGAYDKFTLARSSLTDAFDQIAGDLRRVAESEGAYFLMHLGI